MGFSPDLSVGITRKEKIIILSLSFRETCPVRRCAEFVEVDRISVSPDKERIPGVWKCMNIAFGGKFAFSANFMTKVRIFALMIFQ